LGGQCNFYENKEGKEQEKIENTTCKKYLIFGLKTAAENLF